MKTRLIYLLLFVIVSVSAQEVSVKKIWDNGKHNAFPSIIEFKGKYYCSFREGETHIFNSKGDADGKVRIIASADGEKWESVALLSKSLYDLRDPKLSITPDGKLMVIIGGSIYKGQNLEGRIPQVSFSSDGLNFTEPEPARIDKKVKSGMDWLWRVTWDGKTGYVVNYELMDQDKARIALLKTTNGLDYKMVTKIDIPDFPNETTVRILPDKEMLMMVRQERGDKMGLWGRSYPPYTKWTFTKMDMRLGGPDFIPLGDNLIVAGSRSHAVEDNPQTLIMTGDRSGHFISKYILPSGKDNSYPGFLIVGDELWVCYYSSHETDQACMYLAKIPLKSLR